MQKIVNSFTVLGVSKQFKYENANKEIPLFWQEHYASGKGKYVCGMFGINIDGKSNSIFLYPYLKISWLVLLVNQEH